MLCRYFRTSANADTFNTQQMTSGYCTSNTMQSSSVSAVTTRESQTDGLDNMID